MAFCHRVRGFGAAYILTLLESQDPVSGVACVPLGPRFRGFWRQTTWRLCTSARSAVVLEGCHSMVTFAVTNTHSVCLSAFLSSCPWFWRGLHPGTFGVSRSCQWCGLGSSWASLQGFLETDYMASLHFGSLCCRARRISLNGVLGFGTAYVLALLES